MRHGYSYKTASMAIQWASKADGIMQDKVITMTAFVKYQPRYMVTSCSFRCKNLLQASHLVTTPGLRSGAVTEMISPKHCCCTKAVHIPCG